MNAGTGTLHLLCGKAASGKSSLALELVQTPGTVMLAEEQWLAELFPWGISTADDYQLYARRVRKVMGPHVVGLLRAGTHVVLDIPANTLADRRWLIDLAEQAGAAHCLHFLDVDSNTCRSRLLARHALAPLAAPLDPAGYEALNRYFVAPRPEEKLQVQRHGA